MKINNSANRRRKHCTGGHHVARPGSDGASPTKVTCEVTVRKVGAVNHPGTCYLDYAIMRRTVLIQKFARRCRGYISPGVINYLGDVSALAG